MFRKLAALLVAFAAIAPCAAGAVTNHPVPYPHDNSLRYAYGYSGFDWPEVYVQRGHAVSIVLEPGEMLGAADENNVVLEDRVRWSAWTSRSGGLGQTDDQGRVVPTTWTIGVQPHLRAEDTWLTIHTAMGRHYLIHLIPIAEKDPRGEHLVAFYYWHPAPKFYYPRRQAASSAPAPAPSASPAAVVPAPAASSGPKVTGRVRSRVRPAQKVGQAAVPDWANP
jgi:hypothetical protein